MNGSWRTPGTVLGIVLLVAAACGGPASGTQTSTAATGQPVLIGVDYDSSGSASPTSVPTFRAIDAAAGAINRAGGVGPDHRPLKVISASDGGQATNAPTVVQSFIDQGAVAIIMASASPSFLQVKPIVQNARIPTLSPINTNPGIPVAPNADYAFVQAPPTTAFATEIARGLVAMRSTRPGFVVDSAPADALNIPIVQKAFSDNGLTIADSETIQVNATDASAAMARLVGKGADAVYILDQGGPVETAIYSGIYQANPRLPRITTYNCNDPSDRVTAPAALDGLVCLSAVTLQNPRSKQADSVMKSAFGSDYESLYLNTFAYQGYQAPYTIAEAIEQGGGYDAASIEAGFLKIDKLPAYWGGPSFTLSYSATKHNGSDGDCAYSLQVFKGNKVSGLWKPYQPSCTG